MADNSKVVYKVAAAIGGAVPATFIPYGAHGATEAPGNTVHTHGTSGEQHTILPKAMAVMDTYSKAEIDAKLALNAERAGRANDGVLSKLDSVIAAVEGLSKKVGDTSQDLRNQLGEVKQDNKNTRWAIAGIVLASALAVVGIVVATQGTMTTANGNVLAAFGAGKEAGAAEATNTAPAPLFDAQTGKRLPNAG